MMLLIESFTSSSGWTLNNATIIENEHDTIIANNFSKSLIFSMSENGTIEKSFASIDVSEYDTLTFHIKNFINPLDTEFIKLQIQSGEKNYIIKARSQFQWFDVPIEDIDYIDSIKITALTDCTFAISSMYAVNFDHKDFYNGLKTELERYQAMFNKSEIFIGTVNALTGEKQIQFITPPQFIGRFSSIRIDDGVNEEIVNIAYNNNNEFFETFEDIQNDYSNASCYIQLPVEILRQDKRKIVPCIAITVDRDTEQLLRFAKNEPYINTKVIKTDDDNFYIQKRGEIHNIYFKIYSIANNEEIREKLSKIIRIFLAHESFWAGNKRFDISYESKRVVRLDSDELQYVEEFNCKVEYMEEICKQNQVIKINQIDMTIESL